MEKKYVNMLLKQYPEDVNLRKYKTFLIDLEIIKCDDIKTLSDSNISVMDFIFSDAFKGSDFYIDRKYPDDIFTYVMRFLVSDRTPLYAMCLYLKDKDEEYLTDFFHRMNRILEKYISYNPRFYKRERQDRLKFYFKGKNHDHSWYKDCGILYFHSDLLMVLKEFEKDISYVPYRGLWHDLFFTGNVKWD